MVGAVGAHAADKPPYRYADCVKTAEKQNHETSHHARWHCNILVQKGWVKKPGA